MQNSVSKSNGKGMLDSFINIYLHTELVDWLYHVSLRCDMCVSTYNVLFSTMKRRLLTMIQQLYIHSATDSNNTRKI